jgi:tetraacyldisaccharide 4'-kinase
MPLKTPRFWQTRGLISYALLPFSAVYRLAHLLKTVLTTSYKSSVPVICIGGIVAGGSGKTPALHALLSLLQKDGIFQNIVILTRGYGGTLKGPTLVDPARHTHHDVGDEALLHATHAPTIVSARRVQGAQLAQAMGADLILMDDGLQNPRLAKTLSLLVLDGQQGTGNGFLLPAGPLREPLASALSKCKAVINVGNGKIDGFTAHRKIASHHDKDISYIAFCGLGYPEKFRDTLVQNGFTLKGFESFADHHPYTEHDIKYLRNLAGDARLITTEKDMVRIPPAYREGIDVLAAPLVFDHPEDVLVFVKREISP